MKITRRGLALGGAAAAVARPAIAQGEPIRLGWLASLTGPLGAPASGFDRGMHWAVDQVNAAGGVKGRKIEVIVRDTQGDPTKAVNATQELVSRQKAHAMWGPGNSGECLATTPIMARQKMPNLHPCVVNALIDAEKYPNAFRLAPSNTQWDDSVRRYTLEALKLKDVAVIGDSTGYGTSAVRDGVANFKRDGANVVYSATIDPNASDVTPDLLRMRDAGAKAVAIWSVTTGLNSRLMNARGAIGWDVPFVGHSAMGTGEIGKLVEKPAYWENVFITSYRSCSYGADGKLPERSQAFVDQIRGKVELSDTSLWWVLCAADAVNLVARAVAETGSTEPAAFIGSWNKLDPYPGLFGDYRFSPQQHNGYPTEEVVMSVANSQRDGAYRLAPGYS